MFRRMLLLGLFLTACNYPITAPSTVTLTPFVPATFTSAPTETPIFVPSPTACIVSPDEFIRRAVVGSDDFVITADKAKVVLRQLFEDVVLYSDDYIVARGYEFQFNGQSELHTTIVLYESYEHARAEVNGESMHIDSTSIAGTVRYRFALGHYGVVLKTKYYDQDAAQVWLLLLADIVRDELTCN